MPVVEKKKYPSARPHRSPDEIAAEIAQWRSRTYYSVSAVALLLVFSGAVTIFAIRKARVPETPAPSSAALETRDLTPVDAALYVQPLSNTTPTKESAEKDRLLGTLGSLSAAHLVQCYLNIGLLADGVESEAYSLEQADETLQSIASLMDQVEGQLDSLAKTNLAPEDRAAIDQIKTATALLGIQAHTLKQYWISGDADDAQRYHEARNASWKGISKIVQPSP